MKLGISVTTKHRSLDGVVDFNQVHRTPSVVLSRCFLGNIHSHRMPNIGLIVKVNVLVSVSMSTIIFKKKLAKNGTPLGA